MVPVFHCCLRMKIARKWWNSKSLDYMATDTSWMYSLLEYHQHGKIWMLSIICVTCAQEKIILYICWTVYFQVISWPLWWEQAVQRESERGPAAEGSDPCFVWNLSRVLWHILGNWNDVCHKSFCASLLYQEGEKFPDNIKLPLMIWCHHFFEQEWASLCTCHCS